MSGPACCTACFLVCPSTWYVYPPPRGQAQFLCPCACPNHSNNSSAGLQHQQLQRQCSFASVVPTPGTAAGKPCSCLLFRWAGDFTQLLHSSNTVGTTLSGNKFNAFAVLILRTKRVITFPTDWSKEKHRVRVFKAMLVLIFIPQ